MLTERLHVPLRGMTYVHCSSLIFSVCILVSFILAVKPDNAPLNITSSYTVHLGNMITINCDYNKTSEREAFTVSLKKEQLLCSYLYQFTSWTKQSCKQNIGFIWIPETHNISFELTNLQINDSGAYMCAVERNVPPPAKSLGVQRTFLHVTARPAVSVSCLRVLEGAPTVLCSSEGFYPAAVEQAWRTIRDGEFTSYFNTAHTFTHSQYLNTSSVYWNFNINTNGTYSLFSYFYLLTSSTEEVIYSCWVNHSSLNQPITVNISSIECSKEKEERTGILIIIIASAVMMGLVLSIAVSIHRFRRRMTYSQSPRGRPQPEPNSEMQYETYSTLGSHRPVPCRINSGHNTSSSVQLTLNRQTAQNV